MEKLQPLIVHRFWILCGIALIMPFVGHWMTTGKISAEIDSRFQKLDGDFKSIPSGDTPNSKWKDGLAELNKVQAQQVDEAIAYLWDEQQPLMTWPQIVEKDIKKVQYQGELTPLTRQKYRNIYPLEVERVWKLADPYIPEKKTGKLVINPSMLKLADYTQMAPTSQQTWDTQEDFWLMSSLMEALARVNEGATSNSDAPIKEVQTFDLMGGTGIPGSAGGPNSGAPTSMTDLLSTLGSENTNVDSVTEAYMNAASSGPSGFGGGGAASGTSRVLSQATAKVDFSTADEFGPEVPIETGEGGGEEIDYTLSPLEQLAKYGMGDIMGGGPVSTMKQMRRYVHDSPDLPYKTRGFYMKLLMDHRKIPDLIVELSNSPWPVRVYRVHQGDLLYDNIAVPGGGSKRVSSTGRRRMAAASRLPDITSIMSGLGTGAPIGGDVANEYMRAASGNTGRVNINTQFNNSYLNIDIDQEDPYAAEVAISGLLTIYKPPQTQSSPSPPAGELASPVVESAPPQPGLESNPTQVSEASPATGGAESSVAGGTAAGNPSDVSPSAAPDTPNLPPAADAGTSASGAGGP